MQPRDWHSLTSADFKGLDPLRTVVVLPVSAIEQHGPHLPLGTDALINAGVLQALAQRPLAADLLLLPPQVIGHSLEHRDFPGTLTQSIEVLLQSWLSLAASVAATGLRKVLLLNTHGGNNSLVHLAALRMRADFDLLAVRANYFSFGSPPGLFAADELRDGIHGGEMETSLLMHLHPELVRHEHLADFVGLPHQMATTHRLLGPEKPVGFGWLAQDLAPEGVCGNAAAADAVRGERLLAHLADQLALLVNETAELPLTLLR